MNLLETISRPAPPVFLYFSSASFWPANPTAGARPSTAALGMPAACSPAAAAATAGPQGYELLC